VFKNVYDSEVLINCASGKDVTHEAPEAEEGNIIVINTCGFIDNAKSGTVNMILEYADKKERGLDKYLLQDAYLKDTVLI
jgi:ribosomal protein S12 methylthiotransferase